MNAFKGNLVVALFALLCLVAFSISREPQQGQGRTVIVIPKAASERERVLPIVRGAASKGPAVSLRAFSAEPAEHLRGPLEVLPPDQRAAVENLLSSTRTEISEEMLRDPDWVRQMTEQLNQKSKPPESLPTGAAQTENPYERLAQEGLLQQPESEVEDRDGDNPYSRLLEGGQASPGS